MALCSESSLTPGSRAIFEWNRLALSRRPDMDARMLWDHFDRIRINSLVHRADRRSEMTDELNRVGLGGDPRVAFFDALVFPDAGGFRGIGSNGSFNSQLTILTEAAAAGESVLILEDDCDFAPGTETYQLPADWDIFYGGYEASDPDDLPGSDIIGAHFMGFSKRTVPLAAAYLRSLLKPDYTPDATAVARGHFNPDIRPSIDGAYVWFRRAHPELKTVFAVPEIGLQRPSRSDCTKPRRRDTLPVLRQFTALGRMVKRRLNRLG